MRAGIRSWLNGDSRRRLLILLDECDQFFEADAPRFDQTKKLKGLGSDTKDAAKVVFAGLHSVQRFSKLASNGPFGHLAQTPKVIGPLAPQKLGDPDEVLRRLADIRADRAEARAFAESTGVYTDPLLAAGYRALNDEFKDGLFDLEGAVTAVALKIDDEDEARWIVNCLDALQVLDREDTQLRLEPVLWECVALNG
ncbi:hypothetical protein [Streptomyces calvus]|uniref:hypothetical protein n=1 Tax=Streptomyces calvus TaxID=67282 RepID=UPI001E4561C1|nr:hypothetical protein [Streptomyces calvus]